MVGVVGGVGGNVDEASTGRILTRGSRFLILVLQISRNAKVIRLGKASEFLCSKQTVRLTISYGSLQYHIC